MTTGEVLHFCGLIPGGRGDEAGLQAQLRELLQPVAHGYGGLAAGADIVAVEALLAVGAQVTAVLPFPPAAYLRASVLPGGAAWVARDERCLGQVKLHVLGPGPVDDLDYAMASSRAMGLARLQAGQLGVRCRQVAIWDGAGAGPAGTAADVQRWRDGGGETLVLTSPWPRRVQSAAPASQPCRVIHALLWAAPPGRGEPAPQTFDDLADAARAAFVLAAEPGARILLDYAAIPAGRKVPAPAWDGPIGAVSATEAFACAWSIQGGSLGRSSLPSAEGGTYAIGAFPPEAPHSAEQPNR